MQKSVFFNEISRGMDSVARWDGIISEVQGSPTYAISTPEVPNYVRDFLALLDVSETICYS